MLKILTFILLSYLVLRCFLQCLDLVVDNFNFYVVFSEVALDFHNRLMVPISPLMMPISAFNDLSIAVILSRIKSVLSITYPSC